MVDRDDPPAKDESFEEEDSEEEGRGSEEEAEAEADEYQYSLLGADCPSEDNASDSDEEGGGERLGDDAARLGGGVDVDSLVFSALEQQTQQRKPTQQSNSTENSTVVQPHARQAAPVVVTPLSEGIWILTLSLSLFCRSIYYY